MQMHQAKPRRLHRIERIAILVALTSILGQAGCHSNNPTSDDPADAPGQESPTVHQHELSRVLGKPPADVEAILGERGEEFKEHVALIEYSRPSIPDPEWKLLVHKHEPGLDDNRETSFDGYSNYAKFAPYATEEEWLLSDGSRLTIDFEGKEPDAFEEMMPSNKNYKSAWKAERIAIEYPSNRFPELNAWKTTLAAFGFDDLPQPDVVTAAERRWTHLDDYSIRLVMTSPKEHAYKTLQIFIYGKSHAPQRNKKATSTQALKSSTDHEWRDLEKKLERSYFSGRP